MRRRHVRQRDYAGRLLHVPGRLLLPGGRGCPHRMRRRPVRLIMVLPSFIKALLSYRSIWPWGFFVWPVLLASERRQSTCPRARSSLLSFPRKMTRALRVAATARRRACPPPRARPCARAARTARWRRPRRSLALVRSFVRSKRARCRAFFVVKSSFWNAPRALCISVRRN